MMNEPNPLDAAMDALKTVPVPQGPCTELKRRTREQMEALDGNVSPGRKRPRGRLQNAGTWAVAAVLLMGAGFFWGRLIPSAQISDEQWQHLRSSLLESLEPTLKAQMEEKLSDDWQKALVFTYAKLMNEVDEQVDQKLNQYAIQVLTVSHANTEQALNNLMELIRQNETRQQARITNALDQMEYERLVSDSQFRTSLANFAQVTQNHLKHTEELINFVAHEQGSASDPNSLKPSPRRY